MAMYKNVEIERLILGEYCRVIPGDWQSVKRGSTVILQEVGEAIGIGIKTFINKTERTIERTKHLVPKTAWDHIKMEWFPHWFQRFITIELIAIDIKTTHTFLCPHLYFDERGDRMVHIAYLAQGNLPIAEDTQDAL